MSSARAPTCYSPADRARFLLGFLSMALLSAAAVGAQPVQLQLLGPSTFQVRTRQTVSFALSVQNEGTVPRTLELQADLPPGWRKLSTEGPFILAPGASELKVIGVLVPAQARAGSYMTTFRVQDLDAPETEASLSLELIVAPETALEVQVLEKPRFAIAGETFQTTFTVANRGNTDSRLDLQLTSLPVFPAVIQDEDLAAGFWLGPGEQRLVVVEVRTDARLRQATMHGLTLRVRPWEGAASRRAYATSVVEVVPLDLAGAQFRHTIRAVTKTTGTASFDGYTYGSLQSSLSMKGSLDEAGRHRIELLLLKKLDSLEDPLVNHVDRYSLRYSNSWLDARLGDHTFSLSPLLAMRETGRGALGTLKLGPFGLTGLYYQNIWGAGNPGVYGGSVDYTLAHPANPEQVLYRAALNLYSALDGPPAYGLLQLFNPSDALLLELDAALQPDGTGGIHPALYAQARGEAGRTFYSAQYLRAWPGFDANYSDMQSLQLSGGLWFLERSLRLRGLYSIVDANLLLDPLLDSAQRQSRIVAGLDWKVPAWQTELTLEGESYRRRDRLDPPDYDNLTQLLRLFGRQRFGRYGFSLQSSMGRYLDYNSGDEVILQSHQAGTEYRIEDSLRADAALGYSGRYAEDGSRWHNVGWEAGLNLGRESTRLEAGLYNRYYFSQHGLSGWLVGLQSGVAHTFPWGHQLSADGQAQVQRTAGAWNPFLRLQVSYDAPLDIPLSRKPGSALVRGKVYREETGQPLKGVLFRLNGLAAVSDSRGSFTFRIPHGGRFYLQVDQSRLGSGLVPMQPMPLAVEVTGRQNPLQIGIAEACEVSGSVRVYKLPDEESRFAPSDAAQPAEVELSRTNLGGLANVLVELTGPAGGVETRRRLTGAEGQFSFQDVRPGRYTLTVVGGNIPSYHRLDPPTLELEIAAGERRSVEFQAIQEQRRIQMVESGLTITLEAPAEPHGVRKVTAADTTSPVPATAATAAPEPEPVAEAPAPAPPVAAEPPAAEPVAAAPEPVAEVPEPSAAAPSSAPVPTAPVQPEPAAAAEAEPAAAPAPAEAEAQLAADQAERLIQQLLALHADQFLPYDYRPAAAGVPAFKQLFEQGRAEEGRQKAEQTLSALSRLLARLQERLGRLEAARSGTDRSLSEAEGLGAAKNAPEELRRVRELYQAGVRAFEGFELERAIARFGAAQEAALRLVELAQKRSDEERLRIQRLMLEVMKELEEASDLTVITEDGTLIPAKPWSGEPYLEDTE